MLRNISTGPGGLDAATVAAAVQSACEDAIDAKVVDLTIPGANTPYNASLAALDAKVDGDLIPRADLDTAPVNLGTTSATIVAGAPATVIKVYAFDLYNSGSSNADVGIYSDITQLNVNRTIAGFAAYQWSNPTPIYVTAVGEDLILDNTAGSPGSTVVGTLFYKQEAP